MCNKDLLGVVFIENATYMMYLTTSLHVLYISHSENIFLLSFESKESKRIYCVNVIFRVQEYDALIFGLTIVQFFLKRAVKVLTSFIEEQN